MNPSLLLSEPLTLGQTAIPRGARYSGKAIALLSLLIGLAFAALLTNLVPFASTGDAEKPATNMLFRSPLAVSPWTSLRAPSAGHGPQVAANALTKLEKTRQIKGLKWKLDKNSFLAVVEPEIMNARELIELRRGIRDAGGEMKTIKNSLAKRAIMGSEFEPMSEYLTGITALVYSNEPANISKALFDLNEKAQEAPEGGGDKRPVPLVNIKAGILEGQVLDEAGLKKLSKMPSKKESMATIAGMLKSPPAKIARLINQVPTLTARAIKLAFATETTPAP
jgi:large subunit ribosomal protein L10